jgi:hypothetical protein
VSTLPAGRPIEVWFQDEMRLGQKNPRTRRWARRGSRPVAIQDLRTASAYLWGSETSFHFLSVDRIVSSGDRSPSG